MRATVKALDQKLPTRGGFYASFNSKGVLVEFSEPVKVGMYSSKKSVKTAVLDTRHILQLWSEYEAREAERAEWVARHKVEADKASAAFAEVLDAVKENMRQKGFTGIGIHTDGSGLYFSGGSISLVTSVCSDGVARPTSFGLYGRITVKDFIMMLRA